MPGGCIVSIIKSYAKTMDAYCTTIGVRYYLLWDKEIWLLRAGCLAVFSYSLCAAHAGGALLPTLIFVGRFPIYARA